MLCPSCKTKSAIESAPCFQAARELEAADKARQEAKTAAAAKAADNEAKTEGQDSKLTKSNSIPKQSPKAGDAPKAGTNKGTQEDAGKGNAADDDDCTPRDSDGNELAVDIDANKLTAAQLQEELTKRGLDVKWQPLKGKKVLVERLQVNTFSQEHNNLAWRTVSCRCSDTCCNISPCCHFNTCFNSPRSCYLFDIAGIAQTLLV